MKKVIKYGIFAIIGFKVYQMLKQEPTAAAVAPTKPAPKPIPTTTTTAGNPVEKVVTNSTTIPRNTQNPSRNFPNCV